MKALACAAYLVIAVGVSVWAQSPILVTRPDGIYVNTMNTLHRPSGQVYITNELIGPLQPLHAQSFNIRMTFDHKIPGSVLLCRESMKGAVCRTLDQAIPVKP